MTTAHCTTCNGTKRVMGMGLMTKDCHVCNGVGHVLVSEPETIVSNAQPIVLTSIPPVTPTVTHTDKRSKAYRAYKASLQHSQP